MSRGYLEARAAWQAWYTIYTREGNAPVGFKHGPGCSAFNALEEEGWPDMVVCSGCRSEIKRPETECTPVYDLVSSLVPEPKPRLRGVRVLRLLEYVFSDAEIAMEQTQAWTTNLDTVKQRPDGRGVIMRSATFPFEAIEWSDG